MTRDSVTYSFLTFGTDDLERSLRLWRDLLGLESVPAFFTPRCLEALWGLPAGTLQRAALLQTPGAQAGRLLLLEVGPGAASVRAQADTRDLCPKNLDVNVVDLPARFEALRSAGFPARSEPVSYRIADVEVREVQFPLREGVNLVLAELLGEPLLTTKAGFGGITSTVTTVADLAREGAFFERLGFTRVERHRLSGVEIETMIDLPRGGELTLDLFGEPAHRFGRAELVSYGRHHGKNLYGRAALPALGLLRGAIGVADLDDCVARCRAVGDPVGPERKLAGIRGCSVRSPAGWWIDILEQPADGDHYDPAGHRVPPEDGSI